VKGIVSSVGGGYVVKVMFHSILVIFLYLACLSAAEGGDSATVVAVHPGKLFDTVFNFTVEDTKTYFVGKSGVLSHNTSFETPEGRLRVLLDKQRKSDDAYSKYFTESMKEESRRGGGFSVEDSMADPRLSAYFDEGSKRLHERDAILSQMDRAETQQALGLIDEIPPRRQDISTDNLRDAFQRRLDSLGNE